MLGPKLLRLLASPCRGRHLPASAHSRAAALSSSGQPTNQLVSGDRMPHSPSSSPSAAAGLLRDRLWGLSAERLGCPDSALTARWPPSFSIPSRAHCLLPDTTAPSASQRVIGFNARDGCGSGHRAQQRRRAHTQGSAPGDDSGRRAEGTGLAARVLYKGKGIRVFRLLVRMKVAQLTGIAAAAVPLTTYASQGTVPLEQLVVCTGLLTGAGVVSAAVWYYTSRYLGELSVLPGGRLRFSTMDFWGHRSDTIADPRDVVPPLQGLSREALQVMAERPLIPVNVTGDRQYFISLRHGHLEDRRCLFELLDGSWGARLHKEQTEQAEAARLSKASIPSLGGAGVRTQ